MKSSLLRRRAVEEASDPLDQKQQEGAEAVTAPKETVLDFVRQHQEDVKRSDKEAPEFFADLHAAEVDGEIDPGNFFVPADLLGSRLDADATKVGNNRVFLKRYGDQPGVFELSGEHGGFGVALRISAITDDMLDDLKALVEYPSLDDMESSKAQHEQIDAAWEDWARFDFIQALETILPDAEEQIDALDDDQVREMFDRLRERVNVEWTQDSTGQFIDVWQVAEACTPEDLKAMVGAPEAEPDTRV